MKRSLLRQGRRLIERAPRPLREVIHSIYSSIRARSWCRVVEHRNFVERRYRDIRLFSPIRTGPTPDETRKITLDIFCWRYTPGEGDLVLDIGAGVGTEAITFSTLVGDAGLVIAVEAHPLTFECLSLTVSANRRQNISLHNVAVMAMAGEVRMTDHKEGWVGNSVVTTGSGEVSRWDGDSEKSVAVEAITLPLLLQREEATGRRIALLKMNIEGAEVAALNGAIPLLNDVDHLAISCHDFKADRTGDEGLRTSADVAALLTEHGFRTYRRSDSRPYVRDVVYAERDAREHADDAVRA